MDMDLDRLRSRTIDDQERTHGDLEEARHS